MSHDRADLLSGARAEYGGRPPVVLVHPVIVVRLEVRGGRGGGEGGEDRGRREDLGEVREIGLRNRVKLRVRAGPPANEGTRGKTAGKLSRAVHRAWRGGEHTH